MKRGHTRMAGVWVRLGLVTAAPVAVFADFLARGRIILPSDDFVYYLPLHILAARDWLAGSLPVWNPFAFAGSPLLAVGQAGVFYPPNLAFLVLSAPLANNFITVLNFVAGGIGAFLLTRRMTGDDDAGLVGGLAFGLCGFMFGHVAHQSISATGSLLPWMLFAFEVLRERVTPLRLGLGGGTVALALFGGHGQMFVVVVLVVVLYAAGLTALDWRVGRTRPVKTAVAMLAVGVGLAAIQLLPMFAILNSTDRWSNIDYETAVSYSFPWSHLPLLAFPYLFGNAAPAGPFVETYRGEWSLTELNGYPGLAALVLAGVGLGAARRDRRVWVVAGVGIVALVMAMGGSTPLGRIIYGLPVLGSFRGWARYTLGFDLAVAVLAGYGVALLRCLRRDRKGALRRAAAVPIGAAVLAIAAFTVASSRHFTVGGRSGVLAVGLPLTAAVAGVGCCLLIARGVRWATVVAGVVVALDAALCFGAFFEWRTRSPSPERVAYEYSSETPAQFGSVVDQPGGIDRYVFIGSGYLPQGLRTTQVKGMRSANGYDPLAPRDYLQMMGRMDFQGRIADAGSLWRQDSRILDLLRVTTVLVDSRSTVPPPPVSAVLGPGLAVPGTGLTRHEYQPRVPDVFMVGEVRTVSRGQALAGLTGVQPFDPTTAALIEDDCAPCAGADRPGSVATVHQVRWKTDSVHVHFTAQRSGLLVVSQAWFPGWKASVDGQPAPVLRTNGIVQGIPIGPGVHEVRLVYEPPGLRAGAALTGGTLVGLALAGLIRRRAGGAQPEQISHR